VRLSDRAADKGDRGEKDRRGRDPVLTELGKKVLKVKAA
jgi:hypothetical protein